MAVRHQENVEAIINAPDRCYLIVGKCQESGDLPGHHTTGVRWREVIHRDQRWILKERGGDEVDDF